VGEGFDRFTGERDGDDRSTMQVQDLGHRAYSPNASPMDVFGQASKDLVRIQPCGFSGWLKNRHVLHWPSRSTAVMGEAWWQVHEGQRERVTPATHSDRGEGESKSGPLILETRRAVVGQSFTWGNGAFPRLSPYRPAEASNSARGEGRGFSAL
jgi:hypothetical protein